MRGPGTPAVDTQARMQTAEKAGTANLSVELGRGAGGR